MSSSRPYQGKSGFVRIWRALFYSLAGLKAAYRDESAFRQELILAVVLVPSAIALPTTLVQKALLIASVVLVLIVELLNSAIEATVDRISLDDHVISKRAKDLASAAVLLSLGNCALIWVIVLAALYL